MKESRPCADCGKTEDTGNHACAGCGDQLCRSCGDDLCVRCADDRTDAEAAA